MRICLCVHAGGSPSRYSQIHSDLKIILMYYTEIPNSFPIFFIGYIIVGKIIDLENKALLDTQ